MVYGCSYALCSRGGRIVNTIGDFFGAIYDGTLGFFTEALRLILAFCRAVWSFFNVAITYIIAGIVATLAALQGIIHLVESVLSGNALHILPAGLNTAFALANSIVPLRETFDYVIILSSAKLTCTAYRFVKSWLPTVS